LGLGGGKGGGKETGLFLDMKILQFIEIPTRKAPSLASRKKSSAPKLVWGAKTEGKGGIPDVETFLWLDRPDVTHWFSIHLPKVYPNRTTCRKGGEKRAELHRQKP